MTGPSTLGRHPELEGRVAVVTGAARGIGRGITARLLDEGMGVAAVDVDRPALDRTVAALSGPGRVVVGVGADVGHIDDVDRVFATILDRFTTIDLLINNAADLQRRRLLDEHQELLDLQLATNITGPYRWAQHAAAVMADQGRGVIINLSSVGGARAHHAGLPYDMTKGAIDAMTRAMAVDLGQYGIRVNAIGPGVTPTNPAPDPPGSPAEAGTRAQAERIPLRRVGTVADVAAAVAFLASDDASYITGHVLYVDGGITAQLSPPGPHAF